MSILTAVGCVIGDGLTLAAEVLCPRDHSCEDRLRSWEHAATAVEDEICDEADTCEAADEAEVRQCACGAGYATAADCPWCREVGECVCWVGHGDCGGCSGVPGISHEPACGWDWNPDCPQHGEGLRASAAVSAAADPSPTVPNAHSVVGGEGRGEDSDILQSASLRRSTDPGEVAAPSPGEIDRAVLNAKNAAADAVKRWAEPPGRGLIGASPAVVAGIAVRAYLEALNK